MITQLLTTKQRGHDIIAAKQCTTPIELHIEAKGEASDGRTHLAALRQLSIKRRDRPSPTMSDVENLHDVTLDRKQNAVDARPATIKKLTDFNW